MLEEELELGGIALGLRDMLAEADGGAVAVVVGLMRLLLGEKLALAAVVAVVVGIGDTDTAKWRHIFKLFFFCFPLNFALYVGLF